MCAACSGRAGGHVDDQPDPLLDGVEHLAALADLDWLPVRARKAGAIAEPPRTRDRRAPARGPATAWKAMTAWYVVSE